MTCFNPDGFLFNIDATSCSPWSHYKYYKVLNIRCAPATSDCQPSVRVIVRADNPQPGAHRSRKDRPTAATQITSLINSFINLVQPARDRCHLITERLDGFITAMFCIVEIYSTYLLMRVA